MADRSIEREIAKLDNFSEIVRKFVQRLGDPSKYEFRGEVIDLGRVAGKCTCDEDIRYIFLIYGPNGEVAPCGSTCIKHFMSYNSDLYDRLTFAHEALMRKLSEAEQARAEALRQAEKERIKPEFEAAVAEFTELCNRIRRTAPAWKRFPLPYDMWKLETALKNPKEYKTTTGYIKFYKKSIEDIHAMLHKQDIADVTTVGKGFNANS